MPPAEAEERYYSTLDQTDLPFASPNGLYNLSKVSVWWLGLASKSNASSPGIRSRAAGMNACI